MKKLTNKYLADLLKNNVKAFNDYRDSFPNQKIKFTKLDSVNLKKCDLDGANLSNMNLEGVNFTDSNMRKVNLKQSNISNCDFTRCYLSNSDLRGVLALNTRFKLAEAKHCDFRGADVDGSKFDNSILHDSDFRGSNLTKYQTINAQCHKESGWSHGGPDYLQTIKTDITYEKVSDSSSFSYEISELFFPFFILIFFAILATFLFSTLFEENTDIHFRAMKDTLQNYIDNLKSK